MALKIAEAFMNAVSMIPQAECNTLPKKTREDVAIPDYLPYSQSSIKLSSTTGCLGA